MSDAVNPIFYLYHEHAARERPPPAATAELHELRGILAMEEGDNAQAFEALSLAIKLAGNPAGPGKQRGLLSVSQGRWADARQDFSTMVERDPENPDGWFLRAQAGLALGDVVAAQADMQQAIA